MSRVHKLVTVSVLAALVIGVIVLFAPVQAVAAPSDDPNCRRHCPPTKKHNGFTCVFAGCDPVTGDCLYAC